MQEAYKHIGFILTTELLFKLSFIKNVLKNLDHWLGLQTIARSILITLPLWDIDAITFNSSSQHLLITIHFAAQLQLAGSHSAL